VLNADAGDQLEIVFENDNESVVVETIEPASLPRSKQVSVSMADFVGKSGNVRFRINSAGPATLAIALDDIRFIGAQPTLGDYNIDGIVNAADYVLWRESFGSTSDLRADGNRNNVVDQADYDVWRANFGETAQSADVGPTGVDDEAFTSVGLPVTVTVLANDTSPDGPLNLSSLAITQQPANGTLSIVSASGEVRYMPNVGFNGQDTFKYTVKDTSGNESNAATVTVSVLAFNTLLGDLDGDANLSDADLDAFDLAMLSRALHHADFPNVDPDKVGDLNGDKAMNAQDRPLLVQLLTSAYRPDKFEPNDSFEMAANLGTVDALMETDLTIHLPGNNDYFQFLAAKSGPMQVQILFDHEMGDLDLFLYDAARQQIGASQSVDDDEGITLTLQANQRYFAQVVPKSGVTQPRYDFTIADAVAPTLVAIDPPDHALRPAGLQSVRIEFSEPIQPASATDPVFQLKSLPGGNAIPITVQQADGGKTILLTFAPLAAGEYQLQIDAPEVKDLSGTPVGGPPIVNRFTTVAATIRWANPAGGSWHTASNWSPARVPGPADDVLIDVPSNVTITFNQGSATVHSLYSAESFQLTGGTLTVSTFVQVDGDFTLGGNATLIGATIRPGASGAEIKLIDSAAILDGVTLDAKILVEHQATLTVRNNLTINGTLTVRKRAGDKKPEPFGDTAIRLEGDQQIRGTGKIFLDGAVGWSRVSIQQTGGTMLSVNPGMTIHGNGFGLFATSSFTNSGTLLFNAGWYDNELIAANISNNGIMGSDTGGGILILRSPQITNSGVLETRGVGSVSFEGTSTFTNSGRVEARGGGRIYLDSTGVWTSNGILRAVENSQIEMRGSYRLAGTTFDGRGGKIISYGVWDNRNTVHNFSATTASVYIGGGTIFRGRFTGTDGAGLVVDGSSVCSMASQSSRR
jgi:hypothetical protein